MDVLPNCMRVPVKVVQGTTLAVTAFAVLLSSGCNKQSNQDGAPPPLEVGVIKVVATPVTLSDEYAAQTEAVDTVEIRARVGGILDRQVYTDGAHVKKDDVLFVIDQQPYIATLAQARAGLAQAEATHLNSKQVLDRTRPLLEEQAVSQQDLDAAVAKERADAANVEAARAQVKTAQLNLGYTTIRASRDGVVSKALVKPGGLIDTSTTLLTTLYSIDPMYVNFTIGEQKWLQVKKQLDSADKGAALPYRIKLADGSEYNFSGRLDFVDAAIDPKSGTLQMRLSVPNPDRGLLAGQFVHVVMPAESKDMIRVPQQAVQEVQGTRSVLIVDSESKVASRNVVANVRIDNDWIIESGLQPGETLIVEGTGKVRPGMPVKPVPATIAAGTAIKEDQPPMVEPGKASAPAVPGTAKPMAAGQAETTQSSASNALPPAKKTGNKPVHKHKTKATSKRPDQSAGNDSTSATSQPTAAEFVQPSVAPTLADEFPKTPSVSASAKESAPPGGN
jgi:membrane fusion protein (multidrug efflux system)